MCICVGSIIVLFPLFGSYKSEFHSKNRFSFLDDCEQLALACKLNALKNTVYAEVSKIQDLVS